MSDLTRKIVFTLALGLGVSFAALAQETAPADPAVPAVPATDAAAAPPAPAPDDLSLGTTVVPEDGVGSSYTPATFDLWEQRCVRTEDGADPCQLYQLLKDSSGNPVAEITMFTLPEGNAAAAGASIVAPLETLLTANLSIAIDATPAKIYPFSFCTQLGCIARVGFTAEEVAQFKKGAKAKVTIVPAAAPDQKVELDLSLKGFTAGFEAVKLTAPKP